MLVNPTLTFLTLKKEDVGNFPCFSQHVTHAGYLSSVGALEFSLTTVLVRHCAVVGLCIPAKPSNVNKQLPNLL